MKRCRQGVIPRIVPANACLPTSAPFDLATETWSQTGRIPTFLCNSIRPCRKTEIQVVARICVSVVSSNNPPDIRKGRKDATVRGEQNRPLLTRQRLHCPIHLTRTRAGEHIPTHARGEQTATHETRRSRFVTGTSTAD